MAIKSVKRSFVQRILGKPATELPKMSDCWSYEAGKITIDLTKSPELQVPGGALRLEGSNLPVRVLVVYSENHGYRAYLNKCTHIGHRRLDPVPGTDTVQCCSINKSIFESGGDKISGPASHSVITFPVEKDQDNLVVLISESL
jgi:nitrite reductase/ring-hydroxylating ferredoxin subunit